MSYHSLTSFRRTPVRQRGAVAIIVGLSMAVLVGFVGLALDLGRLYVAKTELQNSADACALAAAQALTGVNANQLAQAEAAGITTGGINRVMFQAEPVSYSTGDTDATDASITFSTALNGTYLAKNEMSAAQALTMRFARCTVDRSAISTWFIQVLELVPGVTIGQQMVRATAVATLRPAQTNCALPVALCSSDTATASRGAWLCGVIGPGGDCGSSGGLTGNFKWVDFTPPGGGANEIRDLLTGSGTCNIPAVGSEVGQPGTIASAAAGWNTRFGIYAAPLTPANAVPDFTGYGYTPVNWPPASNAYENFRTQRNANAPYQGDASTGLDTRGTVQTSQYLAANGADRRLAIVPEVDCAGFVSGSTAPITNWACILMLHPINNDSGGTGTGIDRMYLEYLGPASDPESPCATLGMPGAPGGIGPAVPTLVQ